MTTSKESKFYTNTFRENGAESVRELKKMGIVATIGDPGPSPNKTSEEIMAEGLGIVGIWIETNDPRPANEIVNEAWEIHFTNPNG